MAQGNGISCIDLFSGAGGLSEGFRKEGFQILVANDFDSSSAETYRHAHPETVFIQGPVEALNTSLLMELTELKAGGLDCLIGGPPCQAFSVYNHNRGFHDDRSGLFREYLRIVEDFRPKTVVMENVTGILSAGGGRAVDEIHASLDAFGYDVYQTTLKAEEFGVPQERRRVFFVGISKGLEKFEFPRPTHGLGLMKYVTVEEAIMDLPSLAILEGQDDTIYTVPPISEYQRLLRRGAKHLYNHVAPYLSPTNVERLKYIGQGGSWRDLPFDLLPTGMKKARRCDHTKRYGRLDLNGLSSTILTKCDLHWGAYIHPTQERTLTVREAARFQSFPDKLRFYGPRVEQYRQVGNAVPPLLAQAVARSVRKCLAKAISGKDEKCINLSLAM